MAHDKFGRGLPRAFNGGLVGEIGDYSPNQMLDLTGAQIENGIPIKSRRLTDYPEYPISEIMRHGSVGHETEIKDGQTKTVISVVGEDWESEVLAVTLTPLKGNENFSPGDWIARVEFGVGGLQSFVDIDYAIKGMSFSIPTSYLRVNVIDPLSGTGRTWLCGAYVALKTMANPIRPQRTITTPVILAGATGTPNAIPNYGLFLRVVRPFTASGSPFTVRFTDPTGAVTFFGDVQVGAFQQMAEIPIPNGATNWIIVNDGAEDNSFRGIFSLSI